MKYYECDICLSLNHATRHHCQHCGSIPAMYSLLLKPASVHVTDSLTRFVHVVRAHGCAMASQRRAVKVYFRTVPATYYAEA